MGMDKFSEEIRRSVGEVRQVTDQLSGVMDQVQKLAPQFDAVLQGMQAQANCGASFCTWSSTRCCRACRHRPSARSRSPKP